MPKNRYKSEKLIMNMKNVQLTYFNMKMRRKNEL